MTESDLYIPIRDWLLARSYEVHVEIFDTDIVAVKDGKLMAIEMKLGFTNTLVDQLHARTLWADYVIAATPGKRGKGNRRDFRNNLMPTMGWGYLLVDLEHECAPRFKVYEFIKPKPQPWGWHKRHDYRIKKLADRLPAQPHEIAGLPSCRELRNHRDLRTVVSQVC